MVLIEAYSPGQCVMWRVDTAGSGQLWSSPPKIVTEEDKCLSDYQKPPPRALNRDVCAS